MTLKMPWPKMRVGRKAMIIEFELKLSNVKTVSGIEVIESELANTVQINPLDGTLIKFL